jgi:HK97 gp10 family phage protein
MQVKADTRQVQLLAAELARAGTNVRQTVTPELREAAKRVRGRGRDKVRKRTGKTAHSITYGVKNKGMTYEVGPTWFVGRFLERGTKKMPAYPFMEPAIAAETDLPDKVADRVAKATFGPQRLV